MHAHASMKYIYCIVGQCTHARMHAHTHAHMHAHTHTHACMHTCTHARTHAHMHTCTTHIHKHTCIHMHSLIGSYQIYLLVSMWCARGYIILSNIGGRASIIIDYASLGGCLQCRHHKGFGKSAFSFPAKN